MQCRILAQKKITKNAAGCLNPSESDSQPGKQNIWVWIHHSPLEDYMTLWECLPLSDLSLTNYKIGGFILPSHSPPPFRAASELRLWKLRRRERDCLIGYLL